MPTLHELLDVPHQESDTTIYNYFTNHIAPVLLNQTVLHVNQNKYRLREIEFYFTSDTHPDPFTHCDELQQQRAIWYFHKTGSGYKGGSYKGLDVAIGQGTTAKGGVLIRSIEDMATKQVICGPSLCVDHILKVSLADSIPTMVERKLKNKLSVDNEGSVLYLKHVGENGIPKKDLFVSARVGLHMTKKNHAEHLQQKYCFRHYRAVTSPKDIPKGRVLCALALLQNNVSQSLITDQIGATRSSVAKYATMYEEGKKHNIAQYMAKLTDLQICGAVGCLDALGTNPNKATPKAQADDSESDQESEEESEGSDEMETDAPAKTYTSAELNKMKVTDLKELLRAAGKPVSGTKPVLIARLLA